MPNLRVLQILCALLFNEKYYYFYNKNCQFEQKFIYKHNKHPKKLIILKFFHLKPIFFISCKNYIKCCKIIIVKKFHRVYNGIR